MLNKMLITLSPGLLILLCYTAAAVGKDAKPLAPTIQFICNGDRGNEQIYLRESERSRTLFNIPSIGPYRNVDQKGHWIYKFDLRGAKRAEADLKVGNSYLIHLSADGEDWQKMLD